VVAITTSMLAEPSIITAPLSDLSAITVVRAPRDLGLDAGDIARPEHLVFASAGGRSAHAWFYAPTNRSYAGPDGERPPLVVMIHGGPTSAARPAFNLAVQYWTSRGIAVVDVDYGGSTGYGRTFRRLLDGAWGIVDVEDCTAAAAHLAGAARADPARLAITGGSAGGFTVLAALTQGDTFGAGASYYGVADLGALARDTHKFESRYLDGLVGPWPAAEAVYQERSPLTHVDRLATPLLVLQGLEDEIVPPAQAEMIVAALAAKQVPHAYLAFEGEQHGFRRAENIVRSLTAELYFYGRVFGFAPDGEIAPVEIAFADRL
jgi:dipeptidyl aminopeptidase/acylaminoacyl peptidase